MLYTTQFSHPTMDDILDVIIPAARNSAQWLPDSPEERQDLSVWMLLAQANTNELTVGPDWYARKLTYAKAAAMEVAEALDHRTWEWWAKGHGKGKEDNPARIVQASAVELADVILFALSALMQHYFDEVRAHPGMGSLALPVSGEILDLAPILARMSGGTVADAMKQSAFYLNTLIARPGGEDQTRLAYLQACESLEAELLHHSATASLIYAKRNLAPTFTDVNAELDASYAKHLHGALACALTLSMVLGVNPIEGFAAKSALFNFRIDNGYREGTYLKIWAGEEDNHHLGALTDSARHTAKDMAPLGTPLHYRSLYETLRYSLLPGAYRDARGRVFEAEIP